MLITFEGLDFSGKTTQIKALTGKLQQHNHDVIVVREPGGTPISEKIRDILLDKKNLEMTQIAELLLFSAARTQLVSQIIIPALKAGKVVICDRYDDSTTAYQGCGRGIPLEAVQQINRLATLGTVPDITFFIDIPLSEVAHRLKESKASADRMESSGDAFYEKVRTGYFEIAKSEPERFLVIDGNRSIKTVADEIWKVVRLNLKNC